MEQPTIEIMERAIQQRYLLEAKKSLFDFCFVVYGNNVEEVTWSDKHQEIISVKDSFGTEIEVDFTRPFWSLIQDDEGKTPNERKEEFLEKYGTTEFNHKQAIQYALIGHRPTVYIPEELKTIRLHELPFEDEEILMYYSLKERK